MKDLLIALLVFTFGYTKAQYKMVGGQTNPGTKAPTGERGDSEILGYGFFYSQPHTLYKAQSSGYVIGNNLYGDKAKAQEYTTNYKNEIKGVLFKLSALIKTSGDASSALNFVVYNVDDTITSIDTGRYTGGFKKCPGVVRGIISIPVSGLDTNVIYYYPFSSLTQTYANFALAVNFDSLAAGDTVGFASTFNANVSTTETSWEQAANGNWNTLKYSWGLDITPEFFPVVTDATGIKKLNAIPVFSAYPNPCSDKLAITLPANTNFIISLRNKLGQEVYHGNSRGSTQINTTSFVNDIYFLSIEGSNLKATQKIVVTH